MLASSASVAKFAEAEAYVACVKYVADAADASNFAANEFVTVVAKLESSFKAAANSLRVSRAPGAPSSTAVTAAADALLIIDCWLV